MNNTFEDLQWAHKTNKLPSQKLLQYKFVPKIVTRQKSLFLF